MIAKALVVLFLVPLALTACSGASRGLTTAPDEHWNLISETVPSRTYIRIRRSDVPRLDVVRMYVTIDVFRTWLKHVPKPESSLYKDGLREAIEYVGMTAPPRRGSACRKRICSRMGIWPRMTPPSARPSSFPASGRAHPEGRLWNSAVMIARHLR